MRDENVSYNFDVLYVGLSKVKKYKFFPAVNFLKILVMKTLEPDLHPDLH
jgi:hypothetical protein